MASVGMQMVGSILVVLGWVGVLLTCIMPMWRVTAFIGITILTSETTWEGIWMTCVIQSTGQMHCTAYNTVFALSSDLKAAQVLIVWSILTGALGLILSFIGGKCTRFLHYQSDIIKTRVATAAGVTLIISGLLCLIPVSWTAVAVVQLYYDPYVTNAQHRDIGAAIYIGWGASILLLSGGGMFCSSACSTKPEDERQSIKYTSAQSFKVGSSIRGSDQVRIPNPDHNKHGSVRSQWSYQAPDNQETDNIHSGESMVRMPSPTKSQLEKTMVESDLSEGLSTKSQLIRAGHKWSLPASETSDETACHVEKTYI